MRVMLILASIWGLVCTVSAQPSSSPAGGNTVDWPNVNNDKEGTRYSSLDQINRENVRQLHVAWTYHTGDLIEGRPIECTPIVVDGVMYLTTVNTKVVALNPATGREIWIYDPFADASKKWDKVQGGVNRGVAYWSDGQNEGQRRIVLGTSDGRLISIDAKSGHLDPSFGDRGIVDLRAGLKDEYGDQSGRSYGLTSAPMVFEDTVILPIANVEKMPSPPGDIRAFDVHSGREVWRFHVIPRGDEFAADQWVKDGYKNRGGANPWAGLTLDTKAGVLFAGTGSVNNDFYGPDRTGDDLYGNCTLAIDARTGKRLWHFQTVHHDLWDHDNPYPPVVVNIPNNGNTIEAVAQITKTGYCFLFDRHTGKPVFDVKEIPVPASDMPGEHSSPTQPYPVKLPPLAAQKFDEEDITNVSPEQHDDILAKLEQYRHGGTAIPPSTQGTISVPGALGGANWSGASFDPATGILYVNTNNLPYLVQMHKTLDGYDVTGYIHFRDQQKYPAIKPPWGLLTAIDLNKGEFAWQVPLGEYPELAKRGVPKTGTENFGGTIVTAGGLVFIGATKDEQMHAFDKRTGELLWQASLPAGGYATPCTYMVGGRQYVVIAAGGGGKMLTKSSDAFVAFALP